MGRRDQQKLNDNRKSKGNHRSNIAPMNSDRERRPNGESRKREHSDEVVIDRRHARAAWIESCRFQSDENSD